MKFRKGDEVLVISGESRGKTGKIEKILPKISQVVVTGINIQKKHQRRSPKNPTGGIVDITSPIYISKLMLLCPSCRKPSRIYFKLSGKNKVRACRNCQGELDTP